MHTSANGHGLIRRDQNDAAVRIRHAQHQHFGHELANLARREINHCQHLFAYQRFRRVMGGDLSRAALFPNLRPEIDP